MKVIIALVALTGAVFATDNNKMLMKDFSQNLLVLQQKDQRKDIVSSGETVLIENISDQDRFKVLDQLVSSYFRLGAFDKAKEKAEELVALGLMLDQPEEIVDSFYKLSAALRGAAGSEIDQVVKQSLFQESLFIIEKAFSLCEEKCVGNKALKARVLFN